MTTITTIPTPVRPAFQPPEYVAPSDDCLALNVWVPADADDRASMHIDSTSGVGPYMDPAMMKLFHDRLWAHARPPAPPLG